MVLNFIILCLGVFISSSGVDCKTATETPMRITVNKLIVQLDGNVTAGFESKYYYIKGDYVNVFCSQNLNATLSVFFSYLEHFGENSRVISRPSDYGIGFTTHLQDEHNSSIFECTLHRYQENITARITFLIKNDSKDDILKIKINQNTVRPQKQERETNIDFNCEYFVIEPNTVIFEGNVNYVKNKTLDLKNYDSIHMSQVNNAEKSNIIILNFNISDNWTTKYFEVERSRFNKMYVTIHFFPELKNTRDECALNLGGLDHNSISLQYYQHRKFRIIYYDFYEGEQLNLICILPFCHPGVKSELVWLNQTYAGDKEVKIILNKEHQGASIHCYLWDSSLLRNITVILRKKLNSTSPLTQHTLQTYSTRNELTVPTPINKKIINTVNDGDSTMWILISTSIYTCVVAVTLITVIYKMYRLKQERNINYLLSRSITSIPTYPSQWDNRYVLSNQSDTTIYTEPRDSRGLHTLLQGRYDYARVDGRRNTWESEPSYSEIFCYANVPLERGNSNDNRQRYVNTHDID